MPDDTIKITVHWWHEVGNLPKKFATEVRDKLGIKIIPRGIVSKSTLGANRIEVIVRYTFESDLDPQAIRFLVSE